jgi:uncharacterized membrane protein YebE (DUF533 family)
MLGTIILIALAFVAGAVLSYHYSAKAVKKTEEEIHQWENYAFDLKRHLESTLVTELIALEQKAKAEDGVVKQFTAEELAAIKKKVSELIDKLL